MMRRASPLRASYKNILNVRSNHQRSCAPHNSIRPLGLRSSGALRWELGFIKLFFFQTPAVSLPLPFSRHTFYFFSQTSKEELGLPINTSSISPVLCGPVSEPLLFRCSAVWRFGWSVLVFEWSMKPTHTSAHWTGHSLTLLPFIAAVFRAAQYWGKNGIAQFCFSDMRNTGSFIWE